MSEFVFKINQYEHIKIVLPKTINQLFRYDTVTIIYCIRNQESYILYKDFIITALQDLVSLLTLFFNNNLHLHESITKDIGYLWNEYLRRKRNKFAYIFDGERKQWVGISYLLWSALKTEAWLFEKNNQLTLEVTPVYKWNFMELRVAKKDPEYIPYHIFIKNYKPYIVTTLDREQAKQWLKQTQELLHIVEENDNKYRDILDAMPVYKLSPQTGEGNN